MNYFIFLLYNNDFVFKNKIFKKLKNNILTKKNLKKRILNLNAFLILKYKNNYKFFSYVEFNDFKLFYLSNVYKVKESLKNKILIKKKKKNCNRSFKDKSI